MEGGRKKPLLNPVVNKKQEAGSKKPGSGDIGKRTTALVEAIKNGEEENLLEVLPGEEVKTEEKKNE